MDLRPVLVTGATGYVGGRLVPRLLEAGHRVRAMGRSLDKLGCRSWAGHENIELARGDVHDYYSLKKALDGCRAAYYLVHSMSPGKRDFAEADRMAAENMAQASAAAKIERVIYLGGLGEDSDRLSEHLRSRLEVAEILKNGPVPLTFLRAAVILGSGSASFEILRYLTERLPVMITPRWVNTECQPIAVSNVVEYLAGCLERPETAGQTYDIGGPDVLTYRDLFQAYAQAAGLKKRLIIPVPFLTPRLSSYWVALITPVPSSLARPLILGLENRVVCTETRIRDIIPQRLLTCREAIERALQKTRQIQVDTCWSDAGAPAPPEWVACGDAPYSGGTILEISYKTRFRAAPDEVWNFISRLGGETGWLYGNFLWRLRGLIDDLVGGVGLRRGRRHPTQIRVGDALDFWRVLIAEPGHRLLLLAEMKLPGQAVLDFTIHEPEPGTAELVQRSRFLPRGLWGLAYWYLTYPLHVRVFKGMLGKLAQKLGRPVIHGPEPYSGGGDFVCKAHRDE